MAKLGFMELRSTCEAAEHDWLEKNLESYAPFANSNPDGEDQKLRSWTAKAMRNTMKTSEWWKAEVNIQGPKNPVTITMFMDFHKIDRTDDEARGPAAIDSADDLCNSIQTFYTIGTDRKSGGGTGYNGCGPYFRRKGDNFYQSLHTYYDPELAQDIALILVPMPFSPGAAMEYMTTENDQWKTNSQFQWVKSSADELKRFEKQHFPHEDDN